MTRLRTICPKHQAEGSIQIKIYLCHWLPNRKRSAMCLLREQDLPKDLRRQIRGLRDSLQRVSSAPRGHGVAPPPTPLRPQTEA